MTIPRLHPPTCYMCKGQAEAPVLSYYDSTANKVRKICSQGCLKFKRDADAWFEENKDSLKATQFDIKDLSDDEILLNSDSD